MSLFDRIITEARSAETFKSMPGTDSFSHTDRYRGGRRNQSPANWFKGTNRRFPVWQQRASAAATLGSAERHHGVQFAKKIAQVVYKMKSLKMCPSVLPQCPPKRNHGPGGKPEHTTKCHGSHCAVTKQKPDYHGKYPWPFNEKGKTKWDKDWTSLGYAKGSHKVASPKKKKAQQAANETIELTRRPIASLLEFTPEEMERAARRARVTLGHFKLARNPGMKTSSVASGLVRRRQRAAQHGLPAVPPSDQAPPRLHRPPTRQPKPPAP